MKSKRKLRNYLINNKAQLGFTWKLLFISILSSSLTVFAVYLSVWPVVSNFVPHSLIAQLELKVIIRLFFLGILLIAFFSAFCIVISHKIFGPVHKMEKHLDQIPRDGNMEKIRLRKGDALESLARKLNKLLADRKR